MTRTKNHSLPCSKRPAPRSRSGWKTRRPDTPNRPIKSLPRPSPEKRPLQIQKMNHAKIERTVEMFDRKTPCSNCPFTRDNAHRFNLPAARVEEILNGPAFQCHKTVNYGACEDPPRRHGSKPQQCAGLMALLHAAGRPNQIMQVAQRLGHFDPETIDTRRTFSTLDEYRLANAGRTREKQDHGQDT